MTRATHNAAPENLALGSAAWCALIAKGARRQGIDVPKAALDRFAIHARELLVWNRKINLTAITAAEDVAIKHFLDSILAANLIPAESSLLDIGSGGGFPGLPLKCLIPSLRVVLIDAVRKKVSFLNHTIRRLKLADIEALHARSEMLAGEPQFEGAFDVVVSRAFSELSQFVTQALPFLAPGGKILAMKGNPSEDEILRLHADLGRQNAEGKSPNAENIRLHVERFTLTAHGEQRAIVIIEHRPQS